MKKTRLTHFRNLEPGRVNQVVFPKFVGAMVGATHAVQKKSGDTTLHYVDGTTETARIGLDIVNENNIFTIVDTIQSAARA